MAGSFTTAIVIVYVLQVADVSYHPTDNDVQMSYTLAYKLY